MIFAATRRAVASLPRSTTCVAVRASARISSRARQQPGERRHPVREGRHAPPHRVRGHARLQGTRPPAAPRGSRRVEPPEPGTRRELTWTSDCLAIVRHPFSRPAERTHPPTLALMRVAGSLTGIAAVLAMITLWMWPTSISVLGTTISCGPPIITGIASPTATDQLTEALLEECRSQSLGHVLTGVAIGTVGAVGGAGMLIGGILSARRAEQLAWTVYQLPPHHPFR